MRIGIISDTHDHLLKIKHAVEIFNEHKIGYLLHAGDYIAPFSLNPLNDLICDWRGVFGNNDGEREGLIKKSAGKIENPPLFLEFAKKRIAVMHEFKDVGADVVIYGHTHKPRIEENNGKLLINPGEACGWLYMKPSIVVLDLETMKPELIYF
ncbi:MAG: metallophosphoesterase [Candidatus Omnitrophica bacterium]|nr:metallophosphoesterase [Candidatus Omnitrophota bacterium]